MLNMSAFGMFHTAIALVAVVAGIIAIVRYGEIGTGTRSGLTYVLFTVATCITGLFIFHHGGFGPPHVLSIITLVVLAIAYWAERRPGHAGLPRYVAVMGYSLTLFFHLHAENAGGRRLPGVPGWSCGAGHPHPSLASRARSGLTRLALRPARQWRARCCPSRGPIPLPHAPARSPRAAGAGRWRVAGHRFLPTGATV